MRKGEFVTANLSSNCNLKDYRLKPVISVQNNLLSLCVLLIHKDYFIINKLELKTNLLFFKLITVLNF